MTVSIRDGVADALRVEADDIGSSAVVGTKIATGAVTNTKLATSAVTNTKLTAALRNPITGTAYGYKVAGGSCKITASSQAVTGLTSVTALTFGERGVSGATVNAGIWLTRSAGTGATLTIYRWKHDVAAASTALVAATTAGTVDWIAFGT